jgi:peptidoglycan pentaglycine glycine transferase (the first glycine)
MRSMSKELYRKEDNLFQSDDWRGFQEAYKRETTKIGDGFGVVLDIPFGKKFAWAQKGPIKIGKDFHNEIEGLKDKVLFVRVEPEEVMSEDIKRYGLKLVTKKSLLSGQSSPKATWVLDLAQDEETLLSKMKQKTRYNIKISEKKGVRVKKSNDVDIFYDLLCATAGRDKGYAPHEKEYYASLIKELGGKGFAQIFVAEKDNEPLSAILVTYYGNVATYLHGGFSDKYRNLMAPYLCQWEAIKEAKVRGCTIYDFWGVAETDDARDPWAGITRFKEGFGGEKVIFPGTYDYVFNNFWYNLLTFAAKVKHLIKR